MFLRKFMTRNDAARQAPASRSQPRSRSGNPLAERHSKHLWMRDLLDHLGTCYDRLGTADSRTDSFLAQAIRRDLDEFRRLCQELQPRAAAR